MVLQTGYKNKELSFILSHQDVIKLHLYDEPQSFSLKFHHVYGKNVALLATQIYCCQKAEKKLPAFFNAGCFYTPRALEQASNYLCASFKSSILSGENLLEICGGLGADSFYLSKSFQKITSIDSDEYLHQLFSVNALKLQIHNVNRLNIRVEDFIATTSEKFDCIYADPDRRILNQRQIKVDSYSPDVISLMPKLLELATKVALKVSPMTDIQYLLQTIPNIQHIHILAIDNEIKEILLICNRDTKNEILFSCHELSPAKIFSISFDGLIKNTLNVATNYEDYKYLFEPHKSVTKAGFWKEYATQKELSVIRKDIPILVSAIPVYDFFGRSFTIYKSGAYNLKMIVDVLKIEGISHLNISCKGFIFNEQEAYKKLKIKTGGNFYLFLTKNTDNKPIYFLCKRLSR